MSAVRFLIITRSPLVPYPLSYMDDSYGAATSGRTVLVSRDGEERELPEELALLLSVWEDVGFDWSWSKIGVGRSITITGINVDLDTASVSLPSDAISRFVTEVKDFLSTPGRAVPLRRWRQLCGWANWALTVRPFDRPLLTPVFAKLSLPGGLPRRQSPFTKVFINQEVRQALDTFAANLERGEPLSLRDPALSRWEEGEEDVVFHTDACLTADGSEFSGMGFWFDWRGKRYHYFSRPARRFQRIQFLETLTVAAAIEHGIGLSPRPRRILVRTDSSPAVYAYDSGAAKNGEHSPMRDLLVASFALLRRAKVDVRVVHIAGKSNVTADLLSRATVRQLRSIFSTSLFSFVSPPAFVGRAMI